MFNVVQYIHSDYLNLHMTYSKLLQQKVTGHQNETNRLLTIPVQGRIVKLRRCSTSSRVLKYQEIRDREPFKRMI